MVSSLGESVLLHGNFLLGFDFLNALKLALFLLPVAVALSIAFKHSGRVGGVAILLIIHTEFDISIAETVKETRLFLVGSTNENLVLRIVGNLLGGNVNWPQVYLG